HVPKHLVDDFRQFSIPLRGHPFLEESWQRRRPLISTDAESDPRIDRDTFRRFPHRSILFVPMVVREEPIGGLFVLWWKQKHDFGSPELRLVGGISRQAGLAVGKARPYGGGEQPKAGLEQKQAQLLPPAQAAGHGRPAAKPAPR